MRLEELEDAVASWPWISVHSHRFGGRVFRFANAEVGHIHYGGVWLMRLSYFRYALKAAPDPSGLFAEACRELHLTAPFKDLLEQFVPLTNKHELAS